MARGWNATIKDISRICTLRLSGRRNFSKWEFTLKKGDMLRNIDLLGGNIKTAISLGGGAVAYRAIGQRAWGEFG